MSVEANPQTTLVVRKKFLGIPYGEPEVVEPGMQSDHSAPRHGRGREISVLYGRPSAVNREYRDGNDDPTGLVTVRQGHVPGYITPANAPLIEEKFDPQKGTKVRLGWGRSVSVRARQPR